MNSAELKDFFGEVISRYSRTRAIEDGYLVDVSETAREAGIKFPVALTRAVWDGYVTPDERSRKYGQSESGRLWVPCGCFGTRPERAEPRSCSGSTTS